MILIGCDFHPSWQQVCWVDTGTGETAEQKLVHAAGEAEKFYRRFAEGHTKVNCKALATRPQN